MEHDCELVIDGITVFTGTKEECTEVRNFLLVGEPTTEELIEVQEVLGCPI